MRYSQPVFRPPSEGRSYILQVTHGCSYNRCSFCAMYLEKSFRPRPFPELEEDVRLRAELEPGTRRVFLADGDAMVLSAGKLAPILECLRTHLPGLERVSVYSDAKGILRKTPAQLKELREAGLELIYMGLESGSETVLREDLTKEATAAEMTEAAHRAHEAGMRTSIMVLLGAGGAGRSEEHARESARVLSEMSPDYSSALTLTVVPGTELARRVESGEFEPITPERSLEELRILIEGLEPSRPTVFRANHASSYLPVRGTLPEDRDRLLASIGSALETGALRPEWMRGL